jgi:[acyl-carrier-protein] S-malonyltransferase
MQSRLALLCPGQGAQNPAMFALARSDPQAGALLDQWLADAQLGAPLDRILTDQALLFANRMAQPLIVAASLAAWEALRNDVPAPALVAGYSIGELSAYGVAGALAPPDAVKLAAARARLMDACLQTTPHQALVALSGLAIGPAAALARQWDFDVAIETGEDSLIAGGSADRLGALQRAVVEAGGRAGVLPVGVASHTRLMRAAVAPFAALLGQHRFVDPQVPVLSGISAEPLYRAEKAITHLSRQIAETIVWKDCMDACAEAGVTVALELGPGAALSRMLHARHPQIECRSVSEFRALDGARRWLARHVA